MSASSTFPPNPTIGAAILTWKAHQTLRLSLESHKDSGLLSVVDDAVVFFQEFDQHIEQPLVEEFGWRAAGSPKNIGIHRGMEEAVKALDTDLVIYLENDCQSIATPAAMKAAIDAAVSDLRDGVDTVQLSDRRNPGEPFVGVQKYMNYFKLKAPLDTALPYTPPADWKINLKRIIKGKRKADFQIGRAVYAEADPVAAQPDAFSRTRTGSWQTNSYYFQWCNRPLLARRDFLLDVIFKRVHTHPSSRQSPDFQTVETALSCDWWREQDFRFSFPEHGPFTHNRVDR
ncbi:hypothetical protein [Pseudovibrio sp. SPO723]|uniref:hypothetical protein n=1 Tax=Nesiotobacter zosterae TaxID=392721 RepID=UPI0029C28A97|nr:hypothetical protein [Pseudovibrio sp. SPO723]MDX5593406.1 hypothetical protein [Pseudovibrio sp. SPO723]